MIFGAANPNSPFRSNAPSSALQREDDAEEWLREERESTVSAAEEEGAASGAESLLLDATNSTWAFATWAKYAEVVEAERTAERRADFLRIIFDASALLIY
jgi:hypothetical protein